MLRTVICNLTAGLLLSFAGSTDIAAATDTDDDGLCEAWLRLDVDRQAPGTQDLLKLDDSNRPEIADLGEHGWAAETSGLRLDRHDCRNHQLTLFDGTDFSGASFTTLWSREDLRDNGWHDRAMSVRLEPRQTDGCRVCFEGDGASCVTSDDFAMRPFQVTDFDASVHAVHFDGVCADASLTLFEAADFDGAYFEQGAPEGWDVNLASLGWQGRAQSAEVRFFAAPDETVLPEGWVTLQGSRTDFVSADAEVDFTLRANRAAAGTCQTFYLQPLANSRYALQACNGNWVRAHHELDGRLIADADDTNDAAQRFLLVPGDQPDTYALMPTTDQGENKKFVATLYNVSGQLRGGRTDIGDWQNFVIQPVDGPSASLNSGWVTLQSPASMFVTVDSTRGNELIAHSDSVGREQIFHLESLGSSKYALRAANGRWVTSATHGGGVLIAAQKQIGERETFHIVELGADQYALKAVNGCYVAAEGADSGRMLADRHGVGALQSLTIHASEPPLSLPPPTTLISGPVTLQSNAGYFVSADSRIDYGIMAGRIEAHECERFYLQAFDDGHIALLAVNDAWVTSEANNDGRVIANRDQVGTWERFALFPLGENTYALRNSEGRYLSPASGAYGPLRGVRTEIGIAETFTILPADSMVADQ